MREESIEAASGAGKSERSRTVMEVFLKSVLCVREYAVERPKTPEPTIKIEDGMGRRGMLADNGKEMMIYDKLFRDR